VTNGTSTSNKMAVQALLAPGDNRDRRSQLPQIAPLRNVLAGAQAALCRSVPDDGIFDVWRGAAEDHQAGATERKADGGSERVKMLDLTNCTFDGHIYNTRRVMEECLGSNRT